MLRREFLKGCAASVAVANPLLVNSGANAATVNAIVDAHCHIFNGDDLPIVGFIEKVVLPAQSEFKQYETEYGHVIRFVIRYLANWIRKNSKKASAEVRLLDQIKQGTGHARDRDQIAEDEVAYLTDLIEGLEVLRIRGKRFKFREGFVSSYLPGIVVGFLHREAYPFLYTGKGYLDNSDNAFDIDSWQPPNELAQQIYSEGKGTLSHFLRWALMFTRYRFELADELQRIHGPRLRLLVPALID
jgi:hypothetical protein